MRGLLLQLAVARTSAQVKCRGEWRELPVNIGVVWGRCVAGVARGVWQLLCCRLGEDVKPGLSGNRPLIEASGVIEP
jgi:hypothetical protein